MGTAVVALLIVGGWGLWIWSLRVEGKGPTAKKRKKKKPEEEWPEEAPDVAQPGGYPGQAPVRSHPQNGGWQSY